MTLIDSHCHLDRLDLTPFDGDLGALLEQTRQAGVETILNVSINMENFPQVVAIAHAHERIFATVGVHPNDEEENEPTVERLVELGSDTKVIAVGETGLDYFRSEGDLEWQRERFRRHIAAAKQLGKPLIIHSREAKEDCVRILREEGAEAVGGIMHCFVDDIATAKAAMELGFYISFSGIVTFNNAAPLREVAQQIPADRFLIETDAPYLAPVPHRGKPNQPLFVRHVAEKLAEVRGVDVETIARQSTDNFYRLFPQTRPAAQ